MYYFNANLPNLNYEYVDTSNSSFINEIWIVREPEQIILETSIFLPVVLFGIPGNILVIYILFKNRQIQTPTNLLIGNMAAADLLSLLIHPWIFLVYDFFQNYQLGSFGCKTEGAVECSILIASVISLSAISYDRLTAIVLPSETRLTRNGAKLVMAVTWVVGILISIPLSLYRTYKERQWRNFLEKYCKEQTVIINIYWHVIITVLVWLPLSIQLICYISIFIKLSKYEKAVMRKLEHHQVNYKKNAVKMMFTVILTFMICRLPFTALIFYRHKLILNNGISQSNEVQNQVNGTYHTLWFVSKFLIYLNAALNPVIYGVTNEKFRKAFYNTKLSKCLFPKKVVKANSSVKPKKPVVQKILMETSFTKNHLFFMFKKKRKSITYQSNDTIELPGSKFDIIRINNINSKF